jgi:ribonuclease P protein component
MPAFSRTYRLVTKKDFQSVFARPSKYYSRYFLALTSANQLAHPRLGIMAQKRYLKLAVERNLVKRIVRESFRAASFHLKKLDIVILMRSECTPLDKKALRQDIDQIWRELSDE